MWIENIVGAIILFLGFMYFQQITTWTPYSFRLGLVIRRYKKPIPGKIPKELIKKEIICNNILFKFNSPTKGFFRAFPKPHGLFSGRRKSYLPSMLGEININRSGIAEVSVRIPLSLILIIASLFLILVGSNIEGVFTLNAVMASVVKSFLVMAIFGVLFFINSDFEKMDLEGGIKDLVERINNDTL
jgi:hypothetical protein